MDLRKFQLTEEDKEYFINHTAGYQPFRIDDEKQVVARGYWPPSRPEYDWFYQQKKLANETKTAHWSNGKHMVIDKTKSSDKDWNLYTHHNNLHNSMFEDFLDLAIGLVDDPMDVLEIGCNDGSLLLRALDKGCTKAIGYDMEKNHERIFDLWQKVTPYDIEFVHNKYNSIEHFMPNTKTADFVIANAVLCHVSDPLHFIKFLSGITNKVLLISCGVENKEGFTINFHGNPKEYGSSVFPDVFTHHTTVSKDLFFYSLRECGFKNIYEIEHSDTYPPQFWYYGQNMMGFIATKF